MFFMCDSQWRGYINKMKHFGKRLKNIFWLCRPYRKYAQLYFFVVLLTSALLEPIDDFFYVYFPKEVVDLLAAGKSFWYVATFYVGNYVVYDDSRYRTLDYTYRNWDLKIEGIPLIKNRKPNY